MADIVDKTTRSWMMASIRSKDTKPELVLRSALHAAGFRFRLHSQHLPGHPDIVLPKYRTAIMVHGCFWHRHPGCRFATMPTSNREFWDRKFIANVARDAKNAKDIIEAGWNLVVVWECELKQPIRQETIEKVMHRIRAGATKLPGEIPAS